MKLEDTDSLESGRLAICDYEKGMSSDLIWKVSSGLPGHQTPDDISSVGRGELPPPYKTTNKIFYVSTRFATSDEIGIAGRYFFIEPEEVTLSDSGVTRSMLRVHFDANVPGTAGCIGVINKEAFEYFTGIMDYFKSVGIDKIPLFILYPF